MKKLSTFVVVAVLLLSLCSASAEGFGVQVIGDDSSSRATDDMSDMQVGNTYEISGYGKITVANFEISDYFCQYDAGFPGDNSYEILGWTDKYSDDFVNRERLGYVLRDIGDQTSGSTVNASYFTHIKWVESGVDADFVLLSLDINNLSGEDHAFLGDATVLVVEDDQYKFGGWIVQYNFNYDVQRLSHANEMTYDKQIENRDILLSVSHHGYHGNLIRAALNSADEQPIAIRYTGHYVIGCALPNDVITGKTPLKIVITMNGEEMTYNIRK